MNLLDKIIKYQPYNEQEKIDKELAIKYIKQFDNILSRGNKIIHFSSSSWIVNKEKTKVLLGYHIIYDSWSWTGGHCDGDSNLLRVALKEAQEETGLINIKPLSKDIFSLEILPVPGHYKNGKYISSHLHLNCTFLLEASENDQLLIKADENKSIKWFSIKDSLLVPSEKWMVNNIYQKLNTKLLGRF